MPKPDTATWTLPPYDLDALQAKAKARLRALGEDPEDALQVYRLVAVLRTEELRASRTSRSQSDPRQPRTTPEVTGPGSTGHHRDDAVGVARSAREMRERTV